MLALATGAVASESARQGEPAPVVPDVDVRDDAGLSPVDRPGLLVTPFTLPQGRLQVETGPMLTLLDDDDSGADATLLSFPTIARFGVTDQFEARLQWGVYNFLDADTPGGDIEEDGFPDLIVGAKFNFLDQDGAVPHSSILGEVTLPVGEEPFGTDDPGFALSYIGGWALRETTDLTAQVGVTFVDFGDGYETGGNFGLRVTEAISDRTSVFAETAFVIPEQENLDDSLFLGIGAMHRITDRVQLDGWVDGNLSDNAPNWLFGVGLSVAFGE